MLTNELTSKQLSKLIGNCLLLIVALQLSKKLLPFRTVVSTSLPMLLLMICCFTKSLISNMMFVKREGVERNPLIPFVTELEKGYTLKR